MHLTLLMLGYRAVGYTLGGQVLLVFVIELVNPRNSAGDGI